MRVGLPGLNGRRCGRGVLPNPRAPGMGGGVLGGGGDILHRGLRAGVSIPSFPQGLAVPGVVVVVVVANGRSVGVVVVDDADLGMEDIAGERSRPRGKGSSSSSSGVAVQRPLRVGVLPRWSASSCGDVVAGRLSRVLDRRWREWGGVGNGDGARKRSGGDVHRALGRGLAWLAKMARRFADDHLQK